MLNWEEYYVIADDLAEAFELEVGDIIYSEYVIEHFLEAKDEYFEQLADNGVEVVLLCSDDTGNCNLYQLIGDSLCTAEFDIELALGLDEEED